MTIFIIGFIITFIGYLVHTLAHYLEYIGHPVKIRKIPGLFDILIFIGYAAWGLMIGFDPSNLDLPIKIVLPVGLVIGLVGFWLFITSSMAKKGFEDIKTFDQVITKGIYLKIRHPMYVGIILIHLGFPLAFNRMWTLLSAVLWIGMVLLWRAWEEQELQKKFGKKYLDYKKRTYF